MNAKAQLARLAPQRRLLVLAALMTVAYVAAINRGQAMSWLIAALLGATLITSLLWPRLLMRRLSVTRVGPQRAQEGQTISFQVSIRNHGWLPRFMVEVVDRLPFGVADADGAIQAEQALGVVAYLAGRKAIDFSAEVRCEKRGHYLLGPVALASSFPLGLAQARLARNDGVRTLTVYPDLFPILALPLAGAPSQIHRGGYLLPEGAGAAEFSGLREYRRGDNPRHLHWPTTARTGELMVREFEPLASACLCIALDQQRESNLGRGRESTFEYAIRIAGSVARLSCLQGIRTRLAGAGSRALRLAPAVGDAHFQAILDTLATVDSDGETRYAQLLTDIGRQCARAETMLLFLSEPAERSAQLLEAVAELRLRQLHVLAVVFDRQSFVEPGGPAVRPAEGADRLSARLAEQGVRCIGVRRGDDLIGIFNR